MIIYNYYLLSHKRTILDIECDLSKLKGFKLIISLLRKGKGKGIIIKKVTRVSRRYLIGASKADWNIFDVLWIFDQVLQVIHHMKNSYNIFWNVEVQLLLFYHETCGSYVIGEWEWNCFDITVEIWKWIQVIFAVLPLLDMYISLSHQFFLAILEQCFLYKNVRINFSFCNIIQHFMVNWMKSKLWPNRMRKWHLWLSYQFSRYSELGFVTGTKDL